ncbi:cbb3-type cytochrome c oxidase subunit I [Seohaeicola saemankumensis]|nr:cbb3-type cytochrome c oxidase subunit I [Seohaeicola saemankumensis]MCA0870610.1 cbb3-type cytochrome c oxidase subunit I [Seohaeicola saemankumensis]
MNGIARYFMILGVVSVLIGMIWGIQMSATQDHGLSPAHAHLNLLGWVTFSIFAFYYHAVPEAAASRLAQIHLAVAALGLVTIVPGIVMALTGQGEGLAKLGSVLSLASMLIFGAVVLRRQGAPVGQPVAG